LPPHPFAVIQTLPHHSPRSKWRSVMLAHLATGEERTANAADKEQTPARRGFARRYDEHRWREARYVEEAFDESSEINRHST